MASAVRCGHHTLLGWTIGWLLMLATGGVLISGCGRGWLESGGMYGDGKVSREGDKGVGVLLRLRGAGARGHDIMPRRRLVKGRRSTETSSQGGGGSNSIFPEGTVLPTSASAAFSEMAKRGMGGLGAANSNNPAQGGTTGFGGSVFPGSSQQPPVFPGGGGSGVGGFFGNAAAGAGGGFGGVGVAGGMFDNCGTAASQVAFGGFQPAAGQQALSAGQGAGATAFPTLPFDMGPSPFRQGPTSLGGQGIVVGNQTASFGLFPGVINPPQPVATFGAPIFGGIPSGVPSATFGFPYAVAQAAAGANEAAPSLGSASRPFPPSGIAPFVVSPQKPEPFTLGVAPQQPPNTTPFLARGAHGLISRPASETGQVVAAPGGVSHNGIFLGLSKGGSANFGFIRPSGSNNNDNNVFVHGSQLPDGLASGSQVEFELAPHEQPGASTGSSGGDGERMQAINVGELKQTSFQGPGLGGFQFGSSTSDKPAGSAVPLSEMFGAKAGEWTCSVCMVSNKQSSAKCVSCTSPAPVSSSGSAASLPSVRNSSLPEASAPNFSFEPPKSEDQTSKFTFGASKSDFDQAFNVDEAAPASATSTNVLPVFAAATKEQTPVQFGKTREPGVEFSGLVKYGSAGMEGMAHSLSGRATLRVMGYSILSTNLKATSAFLAGLIGMDCVRHDAFCQTLDNAGGREGGWSRSVFKFQQGGELAAKLEVVSSLELEGQILDSDSVMLVITSSKAHDRLVKRSHKQFSDGGILVLVPGAACSTLVYPAMKAHEELAEIVLSVPDVDKASSFWSSVMGAEMVDKGGWESGKVTFRYGGVGCRVSLRRGGGRGRGFGRLLAAGTDEVLRLVEGKAIKEGHDHQMHLMSLPSPGNQTLKMMLMQSPGGHEIAAVDKDSVLRLHATQHDSATGLEASIAAAEQRGLTKQLHGKAASAADVWMAFSRQPDSLSRLAHTRFAVEWLPSGYILDGVESEGAGVQISRSTQEGGGLENESCISVQGVNGPLNIWRAEDCDGEWQDEEFLYVDSEQRGLLLGLLRDMERNPEGFANRSILVPRAVYTF